MTHVPDRGPLPRPDTAGRLARLAAAERPESRAGQRVLSWHLKPKRPMWLSRQAYGRIVADLRFGELATAEACQRMMALLPEPEAKACLVRQRDDERDHAAIYGRYLTCLEVEPTPSPGLREVYRRCLAWPGNPLALVLAFDVVLEGEALRLQRFFARRMPCPLFREINRAILIDEARHVAFGRLYGTVGVSALSVDERLDLYRWLKGLWWDCARVIRSRNLGPGGWVLRALHPSLAASWRQQSDRLVGMGLFRPGEGSRATRS